MLPSEEEGERLRRRLPNCEIRTFRDKGHVLFLVRHNLSHLVIFLDNPEKAYLFRIACGKKGVKLRGYEHENAKCFFFFFFY